MNEVPRPFADRFDSWRKVMASMPDPDARFTTFVNLVNDAATYVTRGLAKTDAVDTLYEIAEANGLTQGNVDDVQTVIADAFGRIEQEIEHVPDWAREDERLEQRKPNGKPPISKLQILSKADFIKGFRPPDYLIEGILQRRFIYSLTGQTGHAKTAVALLIAALVSSNAPNLTLGTHRVEHGRVIYFVGENPDDVRMRVIGADSRRKDDDPMDDKISFIPGIFNIVEMFGALEADLRQRGEASLIIVDTSAAYFLGNEELNNVQMGAYARALRALTTLPGNPTTLVLCHPIKHVIEPAQLVPRGGGAYLAEMDGNLTLWRSGDDMVELHHTAKFRGPDFAPVSFKLDTIRNAPTLIDAKGRQISTVQAVVISQSEEDKQRARETNDEDHLLAAILKHEKASFVEWATDIGWTMADGSPHKKKVERILKRLEVGKPKLTVRNRHGWALTEEGRKQAREAALAIERQRAAQQQATMEF